MLKNEKIKIKIIKMIKIIDEFPSLSFVHHARVFWSRCVVEVLIAKTKEKKISKEPCDNERSKKFSCKS